MALSRSFKAASIVTTCALLALYLGVGTVSGESAYLEKELTTTGNLEGNTEYLMDYDTYLFNLSTSDSITYTITVMGPGQVLVFLALGHGSLLLADCDTQHSTENPVSSYSSEFSPSSIHDTEKFQIGVMNAVEQEINYSISLKITRDDPLLPTSFFICLGIVCPIAIIGAIVAVIIIIVLYTRRKKGQAVNPPAQYPPSDPYGQHRQGSSQDPYRQHREWSEQDPYGQQGQYGNHRQYPPSDPYGQHREWPRQEHAERDHKPNRFCPECGSMTTSYNGGGEWCDDCGGFI